jgi:hypothetical protein
MTDRIAKRHRQREVNDEPHPLSSRSTEADTSVEAEEGLIADARDDQNAARRSGAGDTQALGQGGRAEDSRNLLGRGPAAALGGTAPETPG